MTFQRLNRETVWTMCHSWELFRLLSNVLECSMAFLKHRFSTFSPRGGYNNVPHLGIISSFIECYIKCSSMTFSKRRFSPSPPLDGYNNVPHLGILSSFIEYSRMFCDLLETSIFDISTVRQLLQWVFFGLPMNVRSRYVDFRQLRQYTTLTVSLVCWWIFHNLLWPSRNVDFSIGSVIFDQNF